MMESDYHLYLHYKNTLIQEIVEKEANFVASIFQDHQYRMQLLHSVRNTAVQQKHLSETIQLMPLPILFLLVTNNHLLPFKSIYRRLKTNRETFQYH